MRTNAALIEHFVGYGMEIVREHDFIPDNAIAFQESSALVRTERFTLRREANPIADVKRKKDAMVAQGISAHVKRIDWA